MQVATWLSDLVAPPPVDPQLLDELVDHLERRAQQAVDGLDPSLLPLRLPKSRLTALDHCERSAVARAATSDTEPSWSTATLRGVALDRFVAHQLAVGRVLDPASDLIAMLAAEGSWSALAAVEDLDESTLAELVEPLATAVADGWGGVDPSWEPRTQSAAMLVLADGAVVCSSVVDVELGGPPGDLPAVVVEVKSGRPASTHPSEVYLYALLVALRDHASPAEVARWYPGTAPAAIAVTPGLLETAAARLEDGISTWAELVAGRTPDERPGSWCRWCPDAAECPSAESGGTAQDPAGGDSTDDSTDDDEATDEDAPSASSRAWDDLLEGEEPF